MKFSLLFLFFFLLVLTPFVSAIPPVQTNINTAIGVQVEFTEIEFIENNQFHLFNAHAFNISNGLELTNDTTSCVFSMFDNVGFHVINEVSMNYEMDAMDWDYNVTATNFTRNGEYEGLIHCNTSTIGGFVSFGFEVTQDGFEDVSFPKQFSVIAFGLILIMFGILNVRYTLLKHMGSLVLMVMGILTLYPGYNNISHTSLFGLALGSALIAIGFWFLIEDSFSRAEQEETFEQDQGEEEEEFRK